MYIELDEEKHIYFMDGEIATISLTQLLSKHGIAPDYSNVDKKVLGNAAKRGTNYHKELEDIINGGEVKSKAGRQFMDYLKEEVSGAIAEQKIGIYWKGITICATADMLNFNKIGEPEIQDHKFNASLHKEYVSWQTSILDYMFRKLGTELINGKALNWKGAKHLWVNWFDTTDDLKLNRIELEKIPDSEIEALFDAEAEGKKYHTRELIIENNLIKEIEQKEIALAKIVKEQEDLQKSIESQRAKLKELMEEQGIQKYESPNGVVKILYTAPYQKSMVDSKRLKIERPDIYMQYEKKSNVKSSIKISVDLDKLEEIELKESQELLEVINE